MASSAPQVKSKIWKFPDQTTEIPDALLAAAGGHEILARLMMRRGISTPELAAAFLDPSKYVASSPNEFADMSKAVARINKAIESKERISVYGDYDVDGVTATSVMLTVLKDLGANVDFYIPNRATEGYGLNLKAVSVLAAKHRTKLIITCDCGISNFAEINLAKSLGVETIIVDHHSMPDMLPPAVATLHPKQLHEEHPLFHLPGVGVAYKLAEALLEDRGLGARAPELHDFVTLGMIADMVPLVKENRYLVQIGLPRLVHSPRAGIRALLDNTVKMDGTDIVGFGLAPRINAVGRLADASLAVNLMTIDDDFKAQELARQLEMDNARRQELCEQIFFEADLKAKAALSNGEDRALALYAKGWHHGVVGIVASRLVEKYHCPVFIAELDEEEGKIKGSARGVSGIDLYQILKANEHLMMKWGGHQMAAGFSAEVANKDMLCRALVDTCNKALTGQNRRATLDIDLAIESELVDLSLVKLLRKLGPFGMWNKKPVLAMKSLQVLSSRTLGKEGKHHRLILRSPGAIYQFECVYWRSADNVPADGAEIDLAFNAEINVFNNSERLQLVLCDWRHSGEPEKEEEEELLDFSPLAATAGAALPVPSAKSSNQKNISAEAGNARVHLETNYDGTAASTSVSEFSCAPEELSPKASTVSSAAAPPKLRDTKLPPIVAKFIDKSKGALPASAETESDELLNGEFDAAPAVALRSTISAAEAKSSFEITSLETDEPLVDGIVAGPEDFEPVGPSTPRARQGANSEFHTADGHSASDSTGVAERPSAAASRQVSQITFKDLREHESPNSVVNAASRKLGDELNVFGESCKLEGHTLIDRTALEPKPHLFLWQFPPSLQVFRTILSKSQASQIYLCGAASGENQDCSSFIKRLLAMVRYAVNQREGQAHAEKLCAGLSTTKMALALGLTILQKLEVIDWYAEDSVIFMELSGSPAEGFEQLPEYRQLANTLREITDFRNWCAEAALNEIQSELVPNAIRLGSEKGEASQEVIGQDTTLRANYYDSRTRHVHSDQPRES